MDDQRNRDIALAARARARRRPAIAHAAGGFQVGFDATSKRKAETCVACIQAAGYVAAHVVEPGTMQSRGKFARKPRLSRSKHVVNVRTAQPGELDWLVLVATSLCERKQPSALLRRVLANAEAFDAAHRMGGPPAVYALLRTTEVTHGT